MEKPPPTDQRAWRDRESAFHRAAVLDSAGAAGGPIDTESCQLPHSKRAAQMSPVTDGEQRVSVEGVSDNQAAVLPLYEDAVSETDPYVLPLCFRITGPMDPGRLASSIRYLVNRHEALRTRFAGTGASIRQVIDTVSEPDFDYVELRRPRPMRDAVELARAECAQGFDPYAEHLFRCRLYKVGASEFICLFLFHHLSCDGWSQQLALSQIAQHYAAAQRPDAAKSSEAQYRDFIDWQRAETTGDSWLRHAEYWARRLEGFVAHGSITSGLRMEQTHPSSRISVEVPRALQASIRHVSAQLGTTAYVSHISAWFRALVTVFGEQSLLLATPLALRRKRTWSNVIGDFTNMLIVPMLSNPEPSLRQLTRELGRHHRLAIAHAGIDYRRLLSHLSIPPVYHVRMGYHPWSAPSFQVPETSVEQVHLGRNPETRRLVSMELTVNGGSPVGYIQYNTLSLSRIDAEHIRRAYLGLLRKIAQE